MINLQEAVDSLAGFLSDLNWIKIIVGIGLVIYLLVFEFDMINGVLPIFWGSIITLNLFLQLQVWVLVKVPRHGWKDTKILYKFASGFLMLGIVLSPVSILAQHYLDSIGTPDPFSFAVILGIVGSPMLISIVGLLFEIFMAAPFTTNLFGRDKELLEVLRKHSRIYRILRL